MYHVVCKLQIVKRFGIRVQAKVLVVMATETMTDTVRMIEHRCNAIESVAIELKFVQPIMTVAQQKSEHLPLRVVEQTRIPQTVKATSARMEVARLGAVEMVQAIFNVFACMRMYQIEQNVDSLLMTFIN